MFFLETILIQQRTSYPDDMQLNTMTDRDLGTCVDIPPRGHRHRLHLFIGHPAADFDVQIHTTDSGVCRRMKVLIPTNRNKVFDEACDAEALTYKGCPLKSASNVCTYTCNAVTFEDLAAEDCAMLYLRIGPANTGVQICEIELV